MYPTVFWINLECIKSTTFFFYFLKLKFKLSEKCKFLKKKLISSLYFLQAYLKLIEILILIYILKLFVLEFSNINYN